MKASIKSEQEVTPEQLVSEANTMYKEATKFGNKLADAYKKHAQFMKSYPIVGRFIYENHSYDSGVFRRWLDKFVQKALKNEEEYFEHQADYVRRLFKHQNPRAAPETARNVFKATLDQLRQESAQFKETVEKVQAVVDGRDKVLTEKNRRELMEYIKNMPPMGSLALESEVPKEVAEFSLDIPVEPLKNSADDLLL